MLLFIQNIIYYMTNEVIEQHWYTFLSVIKMVSWNLNIILLIFFLIKLIGSFSESEYRWRDEAPLGISEELYERLYVNIIDAD